MLKGELKNSLMKNDYSNNLLEDENFLILIQKIEELEKITENKEYKT